MKVIDLLNKIANGEEVPNKVIDKTRGILIESTEVYNLYDKLYEEDIYINDEVEIIEEEKKDNFTGWKMYQDGKEVCSMDCSVEEKKIPEKIEEREIEISMAIGEQICANKINEIINYLDYLKSKGD